MGQTTLLPNVGLGRSVRSLAAHVRAAGARLSRRGRRGGARLAGLRWSGVAALLAGATAVLVLLGWGFDVPALRTPSPGWVSTKSSMALGALFAALGLWLLRPEEPSERRLALGKLMAALTVFIGVLTLLEYLYRVDLGIDRLLFEDPRPDRFTIDPGRMAPSAAACLIFLGSALYFLDTESRARRWPAGYLAGAVLVIVLPRLVGYLYGVVPRTGTQSPMLGVYGAVMLALLALGVFAARPRRGLFGVLLRSTVGGRAALRMLWAALIVPLALGGLMMAASAVGLISPAHATPLTVAGVMIALCVMLLDAAETARRSESERESTMQRLQAQNAATRALIEAGSMAEAAPRFLASLADSLGWDFAALWQVRPEGGVLECGHVWHRADVDVSRFTEATRRMRLAPGVELPGLVWMTGQPEWVPDIQRSPSLRSDPAARVGLRAGLAFPVRYGAEIKGVIEVFARSVRDPDRDLLAVAPILGSQIGEALERKRAEELLHGSEARFRSVAESAADAIVTVDGTGTITYANPAAERMFRARAAELPGQPLERLLPGVSEIDGALLAGTVERAARRSDGSELPVELSAARWETVEGRFSTVIIRDVSARKQAERALRQARDAAEASNRELEAFSYFVSHDLRTPVRSIDGFTQAILEDLGDRLGDEGRESLLRVRAAAARMSQLIDDLLELSRTSRTALHLQPVDLSTMTREIEEELRAREPRRDAELVVDPGVTVWADARLLRVLLQNLLENAWKFTSRQPRTRIHVGAFFDREPIYFVKDNGIGFDMSFRERLFSPFQRLHEHQDYPGTGVGLALAQRIVVRHGGRIWAESAVGKGATFYFTLPGPAGRIP